MRNICISGASGFVGKNLVQTLSQKSYDVISLTREQLDISFDQIICDVFIHCAARAHVMDEDSTDPFKAYYSSNVELTLSLAKKCVLARVKRFIFISSVKVNGESTFYGKPFTHLDECNPQDLYGKSKFQAEEELIELGKETGLEIVIIRPPLVYGEGVKANFASLFKFVGKRIPLPFRAITNNRRSLVSVYNLVDLIKVCVDHPNAANQIFRISDDKDISTSEMIALMAKVQGSPNYSLPLPIWCFHLLGKLLSKQDVIDRLVGSLQVDITHTKETLNWTPPFSIEEGFAKCIERRDV